ncbi:MAG: hypothetical protein D6756_08960 [Cyanobacteria bacterium J083]|nr:MAG: hypothetical protein D6756_08960 [Cyanobacteria bacterium J083]
MFQSKSLANTPENQWRFKLDRFSDKYAQELAALSWGLAQEWGEESNILGIDLKPKPHFVPCSLEAIATLNKNTKGQIQEIVGIVNNYQPDSEVVILAIGEGQVKLIYFQPPLPPRECFATLGQELDSLIVFLEQELSAIFTEKPHR